MDTPTGVNAMAKVKTVEGFDIWCTSGNFTIYPPNGKRSIGHPSGSLNNAEKRIKAILRRRVKKCPECRSYDIGQLTEGLSSNTEKYEEEGGRYYCVKCGWSEPPRAHTKEGST